MPKAKDTVFWNVPLTEAKFDDEKKEIEVTALASGWSTNGNYYSDEVAESLGSFLLEHRKVHMNHRDTPQTRRFGRDLQEWAGTVLEAQGIDGRCVARIDMTGNGQTAWLYTEAKKNPKNLQLSIDASVRISEGEIDGRKGRIVEEFKKATVDFVGYASAGGQAERILASQGYVEDMDEAITLKGYLDEKMNAQKARDDYWKVFDALWQLLRDVTIDEDLKDKERDAIIETGLSDFKKKVMALPLSDIFDKKNGIYAAAVKDAVEDFAQLLEVAAPDTFLDLLTMSEKDWENVSDVDISEAVKFSDADWSTVNKSKLPASAFLIVGDKDKKNTWHLPYKDIAGNVNKGALRAISVIVKSGQFRGQALSFTIPKAVRDKVEGLLKLAKIGQYAKKTTESKGGDRDMEKVEFMQAAKENPDWVKETEEVKAVSEQLTKNQTALEENTKILNSVQGELDEAKVKEQAHGKAVQVDALLKDSKLTESQVSEHFRSRLLAIEKEDEIKEAITDRVEVVMAASGKVTDVGENKPPAKKDQEGAKKALTDEEAEALLR